MKQKCEYTDFGNFCWSSYQFITRIPVTHMIFNEISKITESGSIVVKKIIQIYTTNKTINITTIKALLLFIVHWWYSAGCIIIVYSICYIFIYNYNTNYCIILITSTIAQSVNYVHSIHTIYKYHNILLSFFSFFAHLKIRCWFFRGIRYIYLFSYCGMRLLCGICWIE